MVNEQLHPKYNSFTFFRGNYKEYYDCLGRQDYNYDKMFDDVKDFIRIATQNGYQLRICRDCEAIIVEFNYQDEAMSGVSLEWLDENEYVSTARTECDNE